MKVSITRFSIVLVLVVQWIAAAMVIHFGNIYGRMFLDFSITLPTSAVIALMLAQPELLVPIAVMTTAMLVAAEACMKSEITRLIAQTVNLASWLMFAAFSLIASQWPLIGLIGRLSP
jgi:hypothetical protein